MAWLVYVGDSRTNKTGDVGMGPAGTWPAQLQAMCSYIAAPVAQGNVYNFAEDSLRTIDILSQFSAGEFNPNPGWPVVFFCWAGINDLIDGETPSQVYTNLQSIWSQARNLNYKVIAFLTGTCATPGVAAQVSALDALILSSPTLYDALVRPDAILPITPWADVNHQYYLDGVHPNADGMGLIASRAAQIITP